MEDVLSLVYGRYLDYGLPQQELAQGRLLTTRHGRDLRNLKLLSDYYYADEWRELHKQYYYTREENVYKRKRVGFFMRGITKEGEYVYLTGVKEGRGLGNEKSLFYVATSQTDNSQTLQGSSFEAVYALGRVRDVRKEYATDKQDKRGLLREPEYVLSRDNYFGSWAKAQIVEPDVFAKLVLTYKRCEKYNIPKAFGLQYVIDGMELINQTANDLTLAAYAVTQGLVAGLDVEDIQEYVLNPKKHEYPKERIKQVLERVVEMLKEVPI